MNQLLVTSWKYCLNDTGTFIANFIIIKGIIKGCEYAEKACGNGIKDNWYTAIFAIFITTASGQR